MKPHLLYLIYLLRHKWYVLAAGVALGVPLWRLVIHDWSKFTRAEWGPYVQRFFGPSSHWTALAFDLAWEHHWQHNPHHWNYWLRPEEDGTMRPNWMPETYVREMVADWIGTGKALGKPDALGWYEANKDRIQLHESSRFLARQLLSLARRKGLIP